MQEQHKLTYAAYAAVSTIRFGASNYVLCVKMAKIGLKISEL